MGDGRVSSRAMGEEDEEYKEDHDERDSLQEEIWWITTTVIKAT